MVYTPSKLATACGMPAGLTDVESETGILKPYYEKYMSEGVYTIPYFDRVYLPSGIKNISNPFSTNHVYPPLF